MSRPIAGVALLVVLGLAGCNRDGPTDPVGPVPGPENRQLELARFTAAVTDLRTRILPALGAGSTAASLAETLGDLERALPVADSGRIEAVLARANASAMQLRADTAFLPDRDVLLLVLDQIDAVRRGGAPRAADETHRLLPARTEP